MTQSGFTRDDYIKDYWRFVRKTVDQYGDKEFIVTPRDSITFREANQRANVICAALQKVMAGKIGRGVGLFIKKPCVIIPAMMGVLKSRNYFVPLDVSYSVSALHYLFENAGIKILLTVTAYLEQARSLAGNEISVINLDDLDYTLVINDPVITYSPDDTVQILFTSGSTGKPKGAIENYRYLARAAFLQSASHAHEPNDRFLRLSTFTFSGPHIGVFTGLVMGYTLCFYDIKDDGLAGLPAWIHEQKITNFHSTPILLRNLVSILPPGEIFPDVVTFHFGAERRLHSDIQVIRKYFPNVKRIQMGFSSTETQSVCSAVFPIDYDFGQKDLPSGFLHKDIKVFIWDETGKPLPRGEEGEIVVYSDALVRGYINNPELTRKKFTPDPDHPGWQYYKTGDWGKIRSDGQLVHLGRIDNMVKIRGIRIELDSIETCMLSYSGIVQVAFRAFEDQKGNKRLASYFVAEKGAQVAITDLRKHLAERLPLQQLPHYLVELDEFPFTANGKIILEQLPLPGMMRPPLANEYVPATDELEKQLVTIWEEQIGINGIGVTDDFFEVGGDSLIGALLFAAVEEILGKNLPVSTLLTVPTVRKQAELIRTGNIAQSFSPIIPINTSGDHAPLFFIPGKGGYPTRIRHLAKKIDPRTPVFALQDLIGNRREKVSRSVETIAAYYLTEIRKLYPHGPYILIGESSGGKIAYEMAQQLRKANEKISLLAMLDTSNDEMGHRVYREMSRIHYYAMLSKKHLSILLKSDWQGRLDYFKFYQENGVKKIKRFYEKSSTKSKKEFGVALPEDVIQREIASRQMMKKYQVLQYPGQVILFKATRGETSKNPTNGWDKVTLGELIVHPLDCYHGSILFEPAVSKVAEIIQGYIDEISR